MAPFGGFLGPFCPKYGSSFLKFRPEVVFHNTKTVSEQSFKIKRLIGNETFPKLTVLVHFGAQFTPGKLKILPKNKIFQKLHPYDYQIAQVPGPDNLQNSYKINKKNIF